MAKKRYSKVPGQFRRLINTERFADETGAIEFTIEEAARSGIAIGDEPEVHLVPNRSGEAWLIVFQRVREEDDGSA